MTPASSLQMSSKHNTNTTTSSTSSSDFSHQLLRKLGPMTQPLPTPATITTETTTFNAPTSNKNKASEERRNRKLKLMEMKSKRQQQPIEISTSPEPEASSPEEEEIEMKKQKRLLRNRQAAQQSRERKKQKLGELEETIHSVLEENTHLKERIRHLEEMLLLKGSYSAQNNAIPSTYTDAFSVSTPPTSELSSSCDNMEQFEIDHELSLHELPTTDAIRSVELIRSSELQLQLAGEELDSFIEEASSPASYVSQSSPVLEMGGDEQPGFCTITQRERIQFEGKSLMQDLSSSSGEPAVLNRNSLQLEEFEESNTEEHQQTLSTFDPHGSQLLTSVLLMISLCLGSTLQNAVFYLFDGVRLMDEVNNSGQGRNPSSFDQQSSPSMVKTRAASPNSRRKKGRWKAVTFPSAKEPSPAFVNSATLPLLPAVCVA